MLFCVYLCLELEYVFDMKSNLGRKPGRRIDNLQKFESQDSMQLPFRYNFGTNIFSRPPLNQIQSRTKKTKFRSRQTSEYNLCGINWTYDHSYAAVT